MVKMSWSLPAKPAQFRSASSPASKTENLARVYDVQRVQRALDAAHHVHRAAARFVQQLAHRVQSDAVLAGAGAFQPQRTLHHLHVQLFHRGHFGGVVGVHQVTRVKVAGAHVADDPVRNARGFGFGNAVVDAFGQA